MRCLRSSLFILAIGSFMLPIHLASAAAPVDEDEQCVGCHINVTPGIVKEYLDSPMALASESVSCTECHGEDHKTMDDHAKASLPTADTCIECHEEEGKEFRKGKHELAWFAMKSQIAYHSIPSSLAGDGYRGCSGCHKIGRKGLEGVQSGNAGTLKHDGGKEAKNFHYGNAQCDACDPFLVFFPAPVQWLDRQTSQQFLQWHELRPATLLDE